MERLVNLGLDFSIIAILIFGIWLFRSPTKAKYGNLAAAFALLCAIVLVWLRNDISEKPIVTLSIVTGSFVGYIVAMKVIMTQIPSMVAFQHGAGGVAAFVVSFIELTRHSLELGTLNKVSGVFGLIFGAATFSGSIIASAKLANKMKQTPQVLPKHDWVLLANLAVIIAISSIAYSSENFAAPLFILVIVLSVLLGVIFSIRIGGADMPVLISFLNATAGVAAALCGMIIENRLLIACGATVAASGSILTHIMCKAMNRSFYKVLLNIQNAPSSSQSASASTANAPSPLVSPPKKIEAERLENPISKIVNAALKAQNIIIVPGYGMAIAQAQFETVSFAKKLIALGKNVRFAIHPVAGRMPGHMNVLLAEADAEYDLLVEMEIINPDFKETDLVLIVGACDVVNPVAISSEGTPISGMPILNAHDAKFVAVCNLDDKPGYSGVKNSLYEMSNTVMALGDAKQTLNSLLENLSADKPKEEKKEVEASDDRQKAIEALQKAQKVIIIPGYGMAIAQAQFKVVELANILERKGKSIEFAIHPVAGRMPGHMNVLLAEAEVDYEKLVEMDEINPRFKECDLAIVVGACDVVNPAALQSEGTPISGMPILLAHEAKKTLICNYDEKPGYSGVENPLYADPNSILLMGDAKETVSSLVSILQKQIK